MSTEKRPYRQRARADRQAETRRRIAQATAELHEEVGPARTTIAEIARRAGVERLTVYNNFPDEYQLFVACQGHFLSAHPPPDFSAVFALKEPSERVEAALCALYEWYEATQTMSANVVRDREILPALDKLLSETADTRMAKLAAGLASGFAIDGRTSNEVRATVRLALDFWTWRRLTREGLAVPNAAMLMAQVVRAAAATAE